jgi:hypothetical protein
MLAEEVHASTFLSWVKLLRLIPTLSYVVISRCHRSRQRCTHHWWKVHSCVRDPWSCIRYKSGDTPWRGHERPSLQVLKVPYQLFVTSEMPVIYGARRQRRRSNLTTNILANCLQVLYASLML